jgi:hypothetical protein
MLLISLKYSIALVGIFVLACSPEEPEMDMSLRRVGFSPGDLISHYTWGKQNVLLAQPDGGTFSMSYRWQRSWSITILDLRHGGWDLDFGRKGNDVYKCKQRCAFPNLRMDGNYWLELINKWNGSWYYCVSNSHFKDQPYFLFGKAVGKKWVPISWEEFPKQLAIRNVDIRMDEVTRDPTRAQFSDSRAWSSAKRLWYYTVRGRSREKDEVIKFKEVEGRAAPVPYVAHDPFPETEAFSYFLKYIKPHWKFNNPVLDMDFTPYEGMHPGQIPFPEELGQPNPTSVSGDLSPAAATEQK